MQTKPDTITVGELLELQRKQILQVNPEYQRGAVWKQAQKKKLVDSVLRGYQIPLIYLHHIKRNAGGFAQDALEVIDGQQRINALYEFSEGAFQLFDPVQDEAEARFPSFVKQKPCPWARCDFSRLGPDWQQTFLDKQLAIAYIETDDPNEARDLFVRLQAGMPLNAQEKRDAWPGQFTEFILKIGGKPEVARFPGHDFFKNVMKAKPSQDRGKTRQLAAQMAMLFLARRRSDGERYCSINARAIDDFYYENLDFDASSTEAKRFTEILDKLDDLLRDQKRPNVQRHEAIHLMLLVDSLWDEYTRAWEKDLPEAFDHFREQLSHAKNTSSEEQPHEYWLRYGVLTRTNSDRGDTIRQRHHFFMREMLKHMDVEIKDPDRSFGPIEREIVYFRDKKRCQVCDSEVKWDEAEIHHVDEHASGGETALDNGVLVHRACHPKGKRAQQFADSYGTGR
jgi:hypothetical protein